MSALAKPTAALSPQPAHWGSRIQSLPLVTLYLSERCNSRCVTCDYWRHGRSDMSLARVTGMLPELVRLRTKLVLLSGGEPLLNPQWAQIASLLRENGMQLWLLTAGLSLVKHARRVSQLCDAVTVSLDGTHPETYRAIRGVNAFDKVCAGIQALAALGVAVSVRVTLQRANYAQLPAFVDLARRLGARAVSFLAIDIANPHAFARMDGAPLDAALHAEDLPRLAERIQCLERDYGADFRSGFISESASKLKRILQYFAAVCGSGPFPPVRCNAPEFSAVIGADGRVSPCFFIPGPAGPVANEPIWLEERLNAERMIRLRQSIRASERPECSRCVCSMWRDPI